MKETSLKTGRTLNRGFILRLFGSLVSIGLLVYLIQAEGWGEFRNILSYVPWYIFLAGFGIILLSRVSVTLRWLVLLRFAKARITFWQAFRLMFMGNFASNFLPSTVGGDVVRLAGLVGIGVEGGVGAASLVLDRLVGMAGMASIGPYGLYLISRQAVAGDPRSYAGMGLLAGLERVPGFRWVYQKSERFIRSLLSSSIGWFRRPESLLLALLCTYGHMLFSFLNILLLLRTMHQTISFVTIAALWSLSYFVALIPVSINGLGLQEVSITMLYSRFGGVSMEAALALAIMIRVLFLLASLPGALFLPEILQPLAKRT